MDAARLLEGLTEAQALAVTSDGAPLAILAGAGSGKTRVLTRRIAWRCATGDASADRVLAVTFTRKAAGELRQRLGALGVGYSVAAGTFHSLAFAQLRRRWADLGVTPPELLDSKVRLLARILGRRTEARPMDVAAEIEWAKARLITPAGYEPACVAAGRTPPLPPSRLASVFEQYEAEKQRGRRVDFDDLLGVLLRHLRDDEAFAAAVRHRHRHLFVDEFQDVNPLQSALLAAWRGDRDDLCVVGDPNQAIYSWNGADPSYLTTFTAREPGATVVRLDDNFRSTPQVLTVATAVLAGGGVRSELTPHKADGPLPTVRSYSSDRDEARGVARAVRERHRPGSSWSRIAVLARTNAQLVLLQEALRAATIPFRVRGDSFLGHPDVKDAIDELRAGGGSLEPHLTRLGDLVRSLPEVDGPAAERGAMLEELVRLGHELLAAEPTATVEWFVKWLQVTLSGNGGNGASRDAVDLATFHAAKGLEWPVVFLVGLEQGLVPISRAKSEADQAEERRLLYVAVTRAEDELHCSWAQERTFGARTIPRRPSPWLDDVQAARAALVGRGHPGSLQERIAAERKKLRSIDGAGRARGTVGAGADPGVLGALKVWRSQAARAAGVPAYVIFHDTTLAAVAEARPTSRASLLALPGLGPVKAERYGDDLLRVVAEHAEAS